MSAVAIFDPLAGLLQQEEIMQCRFCRCTENEPCSIGIAENKDGTQRLARTLEETCRVMPCSWYLESVCNAPACLEKLIAECKGKVLLFDSEGRKVG